MAEKYEAGSPRTIDFILENYRRKRAENRSGRHGTVFHQQSTTAASAAERSLRLIAVTTYPRIIKKDVSWYLITNHLLQEATPGNLRTLLAPRSCGAFLTSHPHEPSTHQLRWTDYCPGLGGHSPPLALGDASLRLQLAAGCVVGRRVRDRAAGELVEGAIHAVWGRDARCASGPGPTSVKLNAE
jgi:hypothetical protein